jgi:hypothetical protein
VILIFSFACSRNSQQSLLLEPRHRQLSRGVTNAFSKKVQNHVCALVEILDSRLAHHREASRQLGQIFPHEGTAAIVLRAREAAEVAAAAEVTVAKLRISGSN